MALVRKFEDLEVERTQPQAEVEARYSIFEHEKRTYVQINTYGRPDRAIPGKVSQVIQLDRQGAEDLMAILKRAFAFS